MTTIAFDTHKFVKILQDAGFEPKQAEAVSNAVLEVYSGSEVVTKQDLREQELRLETRLMGLDAKISDIKYDLVKWIAGMMLAQAGVIAALVKLL
ncbi:MAG: DUF1640 domain-containing protein [Methylobacter sp.]